MKTVSQIMQEATLLGDGVLQVTPDEFQLLCEDVESRDVYLMPTPPVKRRSVHRSLFSSFEEVEHDHHAPEYLRQMEVWRERQSRRRNGIEIFTAIGSVKIEPLKDD